MRISVVLLLWCLSVSAHAGTVLIMGDSISAAYGLDKAQGWTSLLDKKLSQQCQGMTVKNASVSGETSAGGLARLPQLLKETQPQLVVIELGGNDGLRGLSPQRMQQNLEQMVQLSKQSGAQAVILGMRMPANLGDTFRMLFDRAFAQAAANQQVPLLPFFLDQVYDQPALMQQDGIHPTAAAQPQLLANAMTVLAPVLQPHCAQLAEAP